MERSLRNGNWRPSSMRRVSGASSRRSGGSTRSAGAPPCSSGSTRKRTSSSSAIPTRTPRRTALVSDSGTSPSEGSRGGSVFHDFVGSTPPPSASNHLPVSWPPESGNRLLDPYQDRLRRGPQAQTGYERGHGSSP